jgi:hypothetical protein
MLDDLIGGETSRWTSGIRNDTIRTTGIASILNFKEGPRVTVERVERDIPKDRLLLNIGYLNLWNFAFLHLRKKVRDLALFLISQKVLNPFDLF